MASKRTTCWGFIRVLTLEMRAFLIWGILNVIGVSVGYGIEMVSKDPRFIVSWNFGIYA